MKVLIVFDSQFGNTEKIARAIGEGFSENDKVKVVRVSEAKELGGVDVLIAGSPTQGGRPTERLRDFLNRIPENGLKGISVAAFDTRILEKDQNFALSMLMKTIGYAAEKISKMLESKGGKLVAQPEGFIVKGKEGPLAEDELERAKDWAKQVIKVE